MTRFASLQALDLAVGSALVAAVLVLWRQSLTAIVRLLAAQGAALAVVAAVLGLRAHESQLVAVALVIVATKAVAIPVVLVRVLGSAEDARETRSLVNVPGSLVAAAFLVLAAHLATGSVVALGASHEAAAMPLGFAIVLVGFFALATRRTAVAQIAGFLIVENGIALVALLATSGVPLLVELGTSLDVLLAALVLQVLVSRMQTKFGAMDLEELQELRD